MNKPWFKKRTFGYGWGTPNTWQGWVVLISYLGYIYFEFQILDKNSHSASDTIRPYLIRVIIATIILFAICYKTSGKPEWRWGNRDKTEKIE